MTMTVAVAVAGSVCTAHHIVTNFRQLIGRQQTQVVNDPGGGGLINSHSGVTQTHKRTPTNTADNDGIYHLFTQSLQRTTGTMLMMEITINHLSDLVGFTVDHHELWC